ALAMATRCSAMNKAWSKVSLSAFSAASTAASASFRAMGARCESSGSDCSACRSARTRSSAAFSRGVVAQAPSVTASSRATNGRARRSLLMAILPADVALHFLAQHFGGAQDFLVDLACVFHLGAREGEIGKCVGLF